MSQQPELLAILERTVSQDPADQQQALQYLRYACEQNYPEFVRQLSVILSNVQNVPFVRQAAGLQLKNTLAAKDSTVWSEYAKRWLSVPGDVRNYVKECVMRTLGTETRPSTAAQCIAAVARIELPENQWPTLIDSLMSNVTAGVPVDPAAAELALLGKESSLEALGYICQDVPVSVLETKSNEILTAIVHGMRAECPAQIRLAASNALLNSLEFSKHNFEKENERNVIMEVVCNAAQSTDTQVKTVALQCLVRIMSLYYPLMASYIEVLFRTTVEAMKDEENEAVVLQGIEFWSTTCEEEMMLQEEAEDVGVARELGVEPKHESRGYSKQALPFIVPILTEQLAKQDEDVDEDEWVPTKAAGVCVMLLAQCCGDAIVDAVLPFVTAHFISSDWHRREAAIMAFGSILEGPSKEKLAAVLEQAMVPLILALGDKNVEVKDTAGWAVGRVCDYYPELAVKTDVINILIPALFSALHDEPRVAANACWAISSLSKAAYQVAIEKEASNVNGRVARTMLSPFFEETVSELLKTTDREDAGSSNLRIAAYEALMEMVKNSADDCYTAVQCTTMQVLRKLESLFATEDSLASDADRSQIRALQSQLCAALHSVLNKIRREDAPLIADAIIASLLQVMGRCSGKDNGAVIEEALMAITALIDSLGHGFSKYTEGFRPHLQRALGSHEDAQVCIIAIGIVSDLCRALESGLPSEWMDEIVASLQSILEDPKVRRDVKSQVLNCFGDVALALNADFERYLPSVVKWLSEAVAASGQGADPDDHDQVDYVEGLRDNCCTAFTGVVQALSGSERGKGLLRPHFNPIWHLVYQVSAASDPPSTDALCASALGLIGDLVCAFGKELIGVCDSEPIAQLLSRCSRSKHNKPRLVASWVMRETARLKRPDA